MTEIIRADRSHVTELSHLFNSYRVFYEQPSDIEKAGKFIESRINNDESTIFVCYEKGQKLDGFVQLYSSFCSVSAGPILILYDLFVREEKRGQGYGRALMDKATEYAKSNDYKRLELSTALDNVIGQKLYESLGYVKDNEFYHYSLEVK